MDSTESFLDIRTHGFVRVAVVVPRVTVCDPVANRDAHQEKFDEAYNLGTQLALAPELGLSAYTAADNFKAETLLSECKGCLFDLRADTRARWPGMMIAVGLPMRIDGAVYNVVVFMLSGKVLAIVPKSYLPTYGEFYERRWFAPASHLLVKEITLFEHIVPVGNDILLVNENDDRLVLHAEVCEDIFVPITPGSLAALAGATVLMNSSASDITLAKEDYRRMLVSSQSARCMAAQLYVSAGYGESTGDLCWDGHGIIAENGTIIGETKRFVREGEVLIRDIDLGLLVHERVRQGTFQDNAVAIIKDRFPFRRIMFRMLGVEDPRNRDNVYQTFMRDIEAHPFVPSDPAQLDRRCNEIRQIQVVALARRLESLPPHLQRVFVGKSGGGDSQWTEIVACGAMDYLGLPRTNIVSIRMPGFGTTNETFEVAGLTSKALEVTLIDHDITDEVTLELTKIGYDFSQKPGVLFENAQAWTRTQVLLRSSAKTGGIVLCTGTLSELAIGWCTMFGDHEGHYATNAGMAKTMIRPCIAWAGRVLFKDDPTAQTAIKKMLSLPQSPELLPAVDGKIAQITEEKVGPYELTDFNVTGFVRQGRAPRTILRMALHAYEGKYNYAVLRHWLKSFLWRFSTNQFKRAVSMEGPKLGLTSLNSRGDWRCPSDSCLEYARRDLADTPQNLSK